MCRRIGGATGTRAAATTTFLGFGGEIGHELQVRHIYDRYTSIYSNVLPAFFLLRGTLPNGFSCRTHTHRETGTTLLRAPQRGIAKHPLSLATFRPVFLTTF